MFNTFSLTCRVFSDSVWLRHFFYRFISLPEGPYRKNHVWTERTNLVFANLGSIFDNAYLTKLGHNLFFLKLYPAGFNCSLCWGSFIAAEYFYSTNVSICLTCLNINLQTSFEWLSMSWSFYIRFQFINRCLRPDEEEVKSRADYERRSGFQFRVTASMSLLKMPLQHLNPHIMCVLCGGYLVDATTIIECLHSCKWKLCHRLEQIRDRTKRWIKFDERALNQKF